MSIFPFHMIYPTFVSQELFAIICGVRHLGSSPQAIYEIRDLSPRDRVRSILRIRVYHLEFLELQSVIYGVRR